MLGTKFKIGILILVALLGIAIAIPTSLTSLVITVLALVGAAVVGIREVI